MENPLQALFNQQGCRRMAAMVLGADPDLYERYMSDGAVAAQLKSYLESHRTTRFLVANGIRSWG